MILSFTYSRWPHFTEEKNELQKLTCFTKFTQLFELGSVWGEAQALSTPHATTHYSYAPSRDTRSPPLHLGWRAAYEGAWL